MPRRVVRLRHFAMRVLPKALSTNAFHRYGAVTAWGEDSCADPGKPDRTVP